MYKSWLHNKTNAIKKNRVLNNALTDNLEKIRDLSFISLKELVEDVIIAKLYVNF